MTTRHTARRITPLGAVAARVADEAVFRALTDRSLEFVSILDSRGRFQYLNPSVLKTLGYAPEELLGTDGTVLVHEGDRASLLGAYSQLRRSGPGTIAYMTLRLHHKDGSYRYFEGSAQNLIHDPAVRGVTTTARDVTWRVEAERSTRALEARFRLFVESAHEAIWALEANGATVYVNPRAVAWLGYTSEELHAAPIYDFMSPASATTARAAFADGSCEENLELDFVRKDARVVTALVTATRIVGDGESFSGILAMITDITPRKAAQLGMAAALRIADVDRRRLEATLQAIPVGVSIANASGQITHSNPAAASIWRKASPRVCGVEPSDRTRWPRGGTPLRADEYALARTLRTGGSVAGELLEIDRFDGTTGHIINSAASIFDAAGNITGAVNVSVDISEHELVAQDRERLLTTLDTERSRLAMVFERAPAFLAVLSGPDHVFERVNPAYHALVGNRPVLGRSLLDALPEVTGQGFSELLDRVRETGIPFVGHQIPVRLNRESDATVETRYLDFVYQRLADSESDDRLVIHGVDVTEQVVAVNALRRSEQRLRDQFAKLPVPTFLWEARDDDFVLIDRNDEAKAFIDPSWNDEIGKTATELFPKGWQIRAEVERCLRENAVIRRSITYDAIVGREERSFDLTIGPQLPDRVLVHSVDTTEQKRLANELRQAQKMEAVGQLAGGVAHDFNNLLTVIGAHSSFLLKDLAENDVRRADAQAIQQAGDRAAGLTRQLLAFSRKQILRLTAMDLNVVVEATQRLLGRILGDDIVVALALAPNPLWALIDIGQVEQVLMNLVLNGRDAMPGGGRITIATRLVDIATQSTLGRRGFIPAGQYASLSVTDSGVGMDAETQAHVFEPFFTTKEVGKGTGLGLATVYGIVTQSGGYVTVDSTIGEGARFDVYFPILRNDTDPTPVVALEAEDTKGLETLLLVEDDPAVRNIARRTLRDEGYRVLDAHDGDSALRLAATHAGAIDAVITDAVMPGMTGVALMNLVSRARPNCKKILMTGYTDDDMTRRGIGGSDVSFIQKPFSPVDLARHVRRVLDSA